MFTGFESPMQFFLMEPLKQPFCLNDKSSLSIVSFELRYLLAWDVRSFFWNKVGGAEIH